MEWQTSCLLLIQVKAQFISLSIGDEHDNKQLPKLQIKVLHVSDDIEYCGSIEPFPMNLI